MMVINIYTGREVAGSILDSSMRFSCDPVLQTRRTWGGRRCGAARSEDDAQAVCRRHPSRPGTASTFAVSNMHIPVSVGSLRGWVLAVCNYAFIVVHRGTKFGLGLVSWTKPAAEGSGPEIHPPRPTRPTAGRRKLAASSSCSKAAARIPLRIMVCDTVGVNDLTAEDTHRLRKSTCHEVSIMATESEAAGQKLYIASR